MKFTCRACSSNRLFEMINLGSQPIVHQLLSNPEDKESNYPFSVYFCDDCSLMQIYNPIDPEKLYFGSVISG